MEDARHPPRTRRPGRRPKRAKQTVSQAAESVPEQVRNTERSLARTIRATYMEMFGNRTDALAAFSFSVEVRVDPGKQWRVETNPPLEERIRSSLREMEIRAETNTGRPWWWWARGTGYTYSARTPGTSPACCSVASR